MTEWGSERLSSLPKVILLISSRSTWKETVPAPTVQSKPGASGLPLVGETFPERKGQTSFSPFLMPRISTPTGVSIVTSWLTRLVSRQVLSHGRKQSFPQLKSSKIGRGLYWLLGEGGGKGEEWAFQSTQKHKVQPRSVCGGPPPFLTQRDQWIPFFLSVLSSLSDPRAQDPSLPTLKKTYEVTLWPFTCFCLEDNDKIWRGGRQRIISTESVCIWFSVVDA